MTRAPAWHNLEVVQGDPVVIESVGSVVGDEPYLYPVDGGDVLAPQIRTAWGATGDPLATMTVTVSEDRLSADLRLSAADTAGIPVGQHVWDYQPDPDQDTWVKGKFTVTGDSSRPA